MQYTCIFVSIMKCYLLISREHFQITASKLVRCYCDSAISKHVVKLLSSWIDNVSLCLMVHYFAITIYLHQEQLCPLSAWLVPSIVWILVLLIYLVVGNSAKQLFTKWMNRYRIFRWKQVFIYVIVNRFHIYFQYFTSELLHTYEKQK